MSESCSLPAALLSSHHCLADPHAACGWRWPPSSLCMAEANASIWYFQGWGGRDKPSSSNALGMCTASCSRCSQGEGIIERVLREETSVAELGYVTVT